METQLVEIIARAAQTEHDLEHLARPLLDLLEQVSGLESIYLTMVDCDHNHQRVLYAHNRGVLQVSEGACLAWSDALSHRVILVGTAQDPAANVAADIVAARPPDVCTYLSVPVATPDSAVVGTLCGASTGQRHLDDEVIEIVELSARLIGDQVAREHHVDDRARLQAAEGRAEIAERRVQASEARADIAEERAQVAEVRARDAQRRAGVAEEQARAAAQATHDALLRFRTLLQDAEARGGVLRERLDRARQELERRPGHSG